MKLTFSDPGTIVWVLIIFSFISIIISFYQIFFIKRFRLIVVLRIISILILIFLFFNPIINSTIQNNRDLIWNIYVDRSLSMAYHSNASVGSLSAGVEDFVNRLKKKQIPIKVFGFGTNIDSNWINAENNFNAVSTNLGKVIENIELSHNSGLAGSIIITDGQTNEGVEILTKELGPIKPIHIIGVGDNNPLVDVAIKSVETPPVIIKGEKADFLVSVLSNGQIKQKSNITLYSHGKLLGSKVIPLSGDGSIDQIRFMITPEQTGEINYKVQINALADEININNNKQIIPIQVLKDEYKIAIITGAPNFNTRIIKNLLAKNQKFSIEHYYYRNNSYSKPLKKFWDTKYDLIIFDNHPVEGNADEWQSYLRIFAKKLLSQKTSFAIFLGNDIDENTVSSYLTLIDLNVKKSLIDLNSSFNWSFTKNWNTIFPMHNIESINYPPLYINMELDSTSDNTIVLADYSISQVKIPLVLISEKSPLRYMVFSSPEVYKLYYKTQSNVYQNLTKEMFQPIFSWLIRTGDGNDFYFRSGKNSYQQGEQITIIGKPIQEKEIAEEGYIHIYSNGKKINTKPLFFDKSKGLYTGKFWASQAGKLEYRIELLYGTNSIFVNDGSVQVQESQIELDNVYLKKESLVRLSDITGGSFYSWENRLSLINKINKKSVMEITHSRKVLHNSQWIFFFIILIFTIEWFLRRKVGMI